MRGLMLFVAGLLCGLAVQATMAQSDGAGATGVVLNHVGLAVPSIPDAAAFYTQKMGFKEAFRNSDAQGNPTAIYLQISKTTFIELQQANAQRPAGINHFGLEAPNIKNDGRDVQAAGRDGDRAGRSERVLARDPGQRHRSERPPHRAGRDGPRVAPAKGDGQLEVKAARRSRRSPGCSARRGRAVRRRRRPPMAEDVFKNVQILKGIPVDEFMGTMGFFSASLGLNCTDCHVDESGGNWAKYADDNPTEADDAPDDADGDGAQPDELRRSAGRHLQHLPSRQQPAQRQPSLALLYGTPPPDEPGEPIAQAPGQPPADRVLDKYHPGASAAPQRLGGAHQHRRQGLVPGFDDRTRAPWKSSRRRPGSGRTVIHTLSGDSTTTFDGRDGWIAAPETEKPVPLLALTGPGARRRQAGSGAVVSRRGSSRRSTKWRVGAPAVINDREVLRRPGHTAERRRRPRCASTPNPACWCGSSGFPSRRSAASSRSWTTRTIATCPASRCRFAGRFAGWTADRRSS